MLTRLYVFNEESIGYLESRSYSALTGLASKGWDGPLEGPKIGFNTRRLRPADESDFSRFGLKKHGDYLVEPNSEYLSEYDNMKILFSIGEKVKTIFGPGTVTGVKLDNVIGHHVIALEHEYDLDTGCVIWPTYYRVLLDKSGGDAHSVLVDPPKITRERHSMPFYEAYNLATAAGIRQVDQRLVDFSPDNDVDPLELLGASVTEAQIVYADFKYGIFNQDPIKLDLHEG